MEIHIRVIYFLTPEVVLLVQRKQPDLITHWGLTQKPVPCIKKKGKEVKSLVYNFLLKTYGWMETCAQYFPLSSDHLLKHTSHAVQNNFYSCGPRWASSDLSLLASLLACTWNIRLGFLGEMGTWLNLGKKMRKKSFESHINTGNQNLLQISICYHLYLAFRNERRVGSSGNCNYETITSSRQLDW